MENTKKYFEKLLLKLEIILEDEKMEQMLNFLELLYEKNKVMNLTAIRDKKGMIEKHFIDSLLLTKIIKGEEKSFIDVGTGAGFPGLVLAIFYPEKEFLLVDSVRKKINFIDEVVEKLNLKNVQTSFERAEELIKGKREVFDVGLCRGVSNLSVILEYEIPFLKVNGRFLPQKMIGTDEVENSSNALKVLNSKILKEYEFKLPFSNEDRLIIEILKTKKTDIKYPRKTGIPLKKPL